MNFRMNPGVGVILAVLIAIFGNVPCSSKNRPRTNAWSPDQAFDETKPLELLEMLEYYEQHGRYDDVQPNIAKVEHRELQGVESYAGYIKDHHSLSHHYFWYFPAKETSENAPVVLYLEGTPGKNMFFSIFTQNGPFSMGPDGQLKLRRESWNNKHHMIYMDSMPGFGYTSGIERNHLMEVRLVSSLRSVLRTFFRIFSSIRQNPFFLAGNYYAWTYLPLLASALHDDKVQRPKSNSEINFKGIIIANGLVNTDEQFSFGDYLYITGLIDDNGKEQFEALERNFKLPTVKSDSKTFYHNFEQLIMGNNSLFKELTGYRHPYNILEDELPSTLNDSITHFIFSWITRLDVRRALHIGDEQKYHPLSQIALTNWKKFVNSGSFDKLSNTFQNDRVLIYTGNLDILCPYPSVERWLEKFSWPNKQEFTDAERIPWYDSSNELAGYIKKSQNIIEFVMINAGHYPCIDQPKRTLELVEGFTHDTL